MSELLRKGMMAGSFLLMIALVIQLGLTGSPSVRQKHSSGTEHCAKQIDVYTLSHFDQMFQSYCSQFDLKADFQGEIGENQLRPGNYRLHDYDRYVSWVICPQNTTLRDSGFLTYDDDWFTVALCNKDQSEYMVKLKGETLYLKLKPARGRFQGQDTLLPNQLSVNEFMSGFSEFSNSYLPADELWDYVDKLVEERERNK